ncbi:hypothetical protein HYU23_00065 [Candidatus Woesearchaeota archaeon]|nr:hypothetical protein [Candidatus Woesearchaeota archaeon]
MKKALTFLFLFSLFLVFLTSCTQQRKVAEQTSGQVTTPIDNDIKNIDQENTDLNDNDLEGVDEDLSSIESV